MCSCPGRHHLAAPRAAAAAGADTGGTHKGRHGRTLAGTLAGGTHARRHGRTQAGTLVGGTHARRHANAGNISGRSTHGAACATWRPAQTAPRSAAPPSVAVRRGGGARTVGRSDATGRRRRPLAFSRSPSRCPPSSCCAHRQRRPGREEGLGRVRRAKGRLVHPRHAHASQPVQTPSEPLLPSPAAAPRARGRLGRSDATGRRRRPGWRSRAARPDALRAAAAPTGSSAQGARKVWAGCGGLRGAWCTPASRTRLSPSRRPPSSCCAHRQQRPGREEVVCQPALRLAHGQGPLGCRWRVVHARGVRGTPPACGRAPSRRNDSRRWARAHHGAVGAPRWRAGHARGTPEAPPVGGRAHSSPRPP